jgi:hypothetical protein
VLAGAVFPKRLQLETGTTQPLNSAELRSRLSSFGSSREFRGFVACA